MKFTHKLFLIVAASFLLLACSAVNLNAQEKPPGERARRSRPASTPVATEAGSGTIETLREVITTQLSQPENTIRVEVRYPTAYGYKYATGLFKGDPTPNSCGEFSVAAAPATAGRPRENRQPPELIKFTREPRMRDSNGVYVCDYLISYLPLDQPINVRVGVGSAREPSTEAWMGGNEAQPLEGQRRAIVYDTRTVMLTADKPRALLTFDMIYSGRPYESAIATPVATEAGSGTIEALRGMITTQEPSICASARGARARNSPAAPGLEARCRASYAATGAAIAEADSIVAAARNVESDALYRQGFDIATGIFGDPALGARGNTATGPGSLGIRDALSAAGQRGFNASVKLHLSRNYRP